MTIEYEYNSNGALTKDRNRGITSITYDLAGNPQTIVLNDGQIMNDYISDERKLSCCQSTSVVNSTDMYIDDFVLRNGSPLMWKYDGGYVSLHSNAVPSRWNFFVTDHLGSTRVEVDYRKSQNHIRETINYYPFGSEMTMTPPAQLSSNSSWQPYRFSGKELIKQNGLNMYDFGARLFDVVGVPMWTSMDPLCENNYSTTPYSYCNGDPVNKVDPDGRDDYYNQFGGYLGTNKATTDNIYISPEGGFARLSDGRYSINTDTRIALENAELDAEAYSKIFTNSLKLAGFNTNDLTDGKIQVTVWDTQGGSKVTDNYTDNAATIGDALATTNRDHSRGAQITAYVWPKGTEEKSIYSTRSNVVNLLGEHEYNGHFIMGYSHSNGASDPVYNVQKNSISWNKTTIQFKNYINSTIK